MFNDDDLHTESGGQSISVEVHGMAYWLNCQDDTALNHTLFMEYNMINRSENSYDDFYFGGWADFDLGNGSDDYIGSDPMRNLFFAYQADSYDEDGASVEGYGYHSPTQGIRIVDGIEMDSDNADNSPSLGEFGNYNGFGMDDGSIDNEKLGLSSFMYHLNTAGAMGDPSIATDYFGFMRNRWRDGTPTTFGGNGYDALNQNAIPARFMFTDSSDIDFYSTYGIDTMSSPNWHEMAAGNLGGDRRGVGATGPFTFEAGSTKSITLAFVFAQKMNDRLGAVDKIKAYSDHIQDVYNAAETDCGPFDIQTELGQEEVQQSSIQVFPNPTNGLVHIHGIKQAK